MRLLGVSVLRLTHARSTLQVDRAQVMYDPHTKDPRGFAFVTMSTSEEADAAMSALNGAELLGRNISIQKVSVCCAFAYIQLFAHATMHAGSPCSCSHSHSRSLLWTRQGW